MQPLKRKTNKQKKTDYNNLNVSQNKYPAHNIKHPIKMPSTQKARKYIHYERNQSIETNEKLYI